MILYRARQIESRSRSKQTNSLNLSTKSPYLLCLTHLKAIISLVGDHANNNEPLSKDHLPLAVSPRFNFKDVETNISSISEEQLTRQLIGLHRAMTHKDKSLLNQLVKQGVEMSLPLRGVTALSLTLYLRHTDMTAELLVALRRTRQLGNVVMKNSYFAKSFTFSFCLFVHTSFLSFMNFTNIIFKARSNLFLR